MQEMTILTDRGALTLPASIRKALGLKGKQQLIVETNRRGEIVLKPAFAVPLEAYTPKRIAEFASEEKKIAAWLKKRNRRPNA